MLLFSELSDLTLSEACWLNLVLLCGISNVVLGSVLKSCPVPRLGLMRYIKFKPFGVNFTLFLSTCSYCTRGRVGWFPSSTELGVAIESKNTEFRVKKTQGFSVLTLSLTRYVIWVSYFLLFEPQLHLLWVIIPMLQYCCEAQIALGIESPNKLKSDGYACVMSPERICGFASNKGQWHMFTSLGRFPLEVRL